MPIAAATLGVTTFLTVFDAQVVAVALPTIERQLRVSQVDAQWVITAYTVTLTGLLLLGGRIGDLLGARRVLVGGLVIFAVGLLGAGFAPGFSALLAARVLQGIGAALAVPSCFAYMSRGFDRKWQPRVFATAGGAGSVAAISGAPLGGIVISTLGWSWIFFLGVPVALAAAIAALWTLTDEKTRPREVHFDFAGAIAGTASLGLLVLGLTNIARFGLLSAATAIAFAATAILTAIFVWREKKAPHPLLDPRLFDSRSLRAGLAGMPGVDFAFNGAFLIGLLYLQQVVGLSPLQAGLAIAPLGVAAACSSALYTALHARIPGGSAGLAMAAIGLAVLAVTSALPRMQLAGSLIGLPLAGFGVALAAVALTREAGSEVPIADKGIAYGVFQTATYLGGCIAVAGLTTIVEAEGRSIAGLSGGYRISFLVAAGVALLSAVAVAGILAPDRRLRRPHVD